QAQRVSAGGRPLANHDVELVVLERAIEQFFERRLQAVYLVDEKHLLLAQIGEDGSHLALDLQRRARGLLKRSLHFVRDDGGEGGLAEAGRAVKQDVVDGLPALASGGD